MMKVFKSSGETEIGNALMRCNQVIDFDSTFVDDESRREPVMVFEFLDGPNISEGSKPIIVVKKHVLVAHKNLNIQV